MCDTQFWMSKPTKQNHLLDQPATFNELLINEVKSHPQLYDQQHRVCTDNGERNIIWDVIARRIDDSVTGEFAKKRWLQMRDRYRKELKMALRTSVTPKWPYFTKLNWLDPYLKDAKSIKSESHSPLSQSNYGIETANAKPMGFGNSDKDQDQPFQFPQIQTVSLLESLMAASRELLERQREKIAPSMDASVHQQLEYSSPDSAVASTSEDGNEQQQSQQYLPKVTSQEDCDLTMDDNAGNEEDSLDTKLQQERLASINQLISQRLSQQAVHSPLFSTKPSIPSQIGLNSLLLNSPTARFANFAGFPIGAEDLLQSNNSQQQRIQQSRVRNPPPYLVRRGKQQRSGGRPQSEPNSVEMPRKFVDIASLCTTPESNNDMASAARRLFNNGTALPNAEEWANMDMENDEDLLFARLIVARMKNFGPKKRREIRSQIHKYLETEEDVEMVDEQKKDNGNDVGK